MSTYCIAQRIPDITNTISNEILTTVMPMVRHYINYCMLKSLKAIKIQTQPCSIELGSIQFTNRNPNRNLHLCKIPLLFPIFLTTECKVNVA